MSTMYPARERIRRLNQTPKLDAQIRRLNQTPKLDAQIRRPNQTYKLDAQMVPNSSEKVPNGPQTVHMVPNYLKWSQIFRKGPHSCFSWSPIQIWLSTKKQLRHFFVILHFPIALQNISKIFILVTDFRTVKIVKIQLFVTSLRYFMLRYVIHIKNVTQEQKDGSYEFKLFWNQ